MRRLARCFGAVALTVAVTGCGADDRPHAASGASPGSASADAVVRRCVGAWNASALTRRAGAATWRAGHRSALVGTDSKGRCIVALDPRGARAYFRALTPAMRGAWTFRLSRHGWQNLVPATRAEDARLAPAARERLRRLRAAPNARIAGARGALVAA